MSDIIGHLKAILELESAQYTEGMKRARKDASDMSEGMTQLGGAAKLAGAAIATAAVAAAAGMAAMVKAQIDAADEAGKAASKYGTTTEAISELDYAAKMSGASLDAVGGAMLKTQQAAINAANGSKEMQRVFNQLGIDVKTFAQMSPDQQLEAMADALQGIENVSQRNALAMKVMGESAAGLADLMKDGSAGIRDLRNEAVDMGLSISSDTAKRAADFNDNMDRLKNTMSGVAMEIANSALPALNRIAEVMAEGARTGGILRGILAGVDQGVREIAGIAGDGPSKPLLDAQVKARDLREELQKYEDLLKRPEIQNSPAFAMMQKRADDIRAKLANANVEMQKLANPKEIPKVATTSPIVPADDPDAQKREKDKIRERFDTLQASYYNEEQALAVSLANKFKIIQDSEALADVSDDARNEQRQAAITAYEYGISDVHRKEAAKRQQIEQGLAEAKGRLNMMVYQSSISLLQAIPGATKAAALAGIAIQKWSAIQAAKSASLAAGELAFASQIIPGDPTSLARAEAARAAVLQQGAATVGLITALNIGSGLLEAANVLKSNDSPSASGTVTSSGGQSVVAQSATAAATPQTVVHVYVTGNVMTSDFTHQQVIPEIKKYLDGEGVLVQQGTRQYDILKA